MVCKAVKPPVSPTEERASKCISFSEPRKPSMVRPAWTRGLYLKYITVCDGKKIQKDNEQCRLTLAKRNCGLGLQISVSFSEPCLYSQGLNPGRRCLWQVVHHLWTAASALNLSSGGPSTDRNISLCSWREERLDLQSVFTLFIVEKPRSHTAVFTGRIRYTSMRGAKLLKRSRLSSETQKWEFHIN